LIGMASHHHTAAIAPRDIARSARGVRSEIVRSSKVAIVDQPVCWRAVFCSEVTEAAPGVVPSRVTKVTIGIAGSFLVAGALSAVDV
jgi:hypothetical protein